MLLTTEQGPPRATQNRFLLLTAATTPTPSPKKKKKNSTSLLLQSWKAGKNRDRKIISLYWNYLASFFFFPLKVPITLSSWVQLTLKVPIWEENEVYGEMVYNPLSAEKRPWVQFWTAGILLDICRCVPVWETNVMVCFLWQLQFLQWTGLHPSLSLNLYSSFKTQMQMPPLPSFPTPHNFHGTDLLPRGLLSPRLYQEASRNKICVWFIPVYLLVITTN